MFDDKDIFDEPFRNGSVEEWYDKVDAIIKGTHKSKYTPKQKEEKL